MSKNKKNKQNDNLSVDEALTIAQGIKQENQTKSQTKLVAHGIRKGIEIYKKQYNKKQRDIDKQNKKRIKTTLNSDTSILENSNESRQFTSIAQAKLAWALLFLSWLFFIVYFFITTI